MACGLARLLIWAQSHTTVLAERRCVYSVVRQRLGQLITTDNLPGRLPMGMALRQSTDSAHECNGPPTRSPVRRPAQVGPRASAICGRNGRRRRCGRADRAHHARGFSEARTPSFRSRVAATTTPPAAIARPPAARAAGHRLCAPLPDCAARVATRVAILRCPARRRRMRRGGLRSRPLVRLLPARLNPSPHTLRAPARHGARRRGHARGGCRRSRLTGSRGWSDTQGGRGMRE